MRVLLLCACCLSACAGVSPVSPTSPMLPTGGSFTALPLALATPPTVILTPTLTGLRVRVTAQIQGGADDAEDYYCPSVDWTWGDGFGLAVTQDCAVYHAGVSIQRQYAADHTFPQAGTFPITFALFHNGIAVTRATASVTVP